MNGWKMILVLAAFAGCSGVQPSVSRELAGGRWFGEIDYGGWRQPLALQIVTDGQGYRGEWSSENGLPSEPLRKVDVNGSAVRLETDQLVFAGQVEGRKLSGTVSRKDTGAPQGQFSVNYDVDPRRYEDQPGQNPNFL